MADVMLRALPDLPEVCPGNDIGAMIFVAAQAAAWRFEAGDVLVIAQKIVSKSEGRIVDLADVTPSAEAMELARQLNVDPRKVEVILGDSSQIIRLRPAAGPHDKGVLITETLSGFICANAGLDESNAGGEGRVIRLPADPDLSARRIQAALRARCGVDLGIIISDTFGRPWRMGETNVALGVARVPAVIDLRGGIDRNGHVLRVSRPALADEIAAASGLVSAKAAGLPVTLVRGLDWVPGDHSGRDIVRPIAEDLFR